MPSHLLGRQFDVVSGWQDSNLRPPGPKPGAITGLRYIPNLKIFDWLIGRTRQLKPYKNFCGEGGIRTHGTV